MNSIDLKLLRLLQEDATLSVAQLADAVNLSTTPCWRRIQNLKGKGVIRKHVAWCDPAKLNVGVTVFISVKTRQHNTAWLDDFAKAAAEIPEVIEFYRMSGDIDYLLRIVVPDIDAYDAVYKKLIQVADLSDVSSSFAMETIKYTTALPLKYTD